MTILGLRQARKINELLDYFTIDLRFYTQGKFEVYHKDNVRAIILFEVQNINDLVSLCRGLIIDFHNWYILT